jgi:dipeptidase E
MKFLLTSAGITNKSIEKAMIELVGKPISETSILFVPTAANTIPGDKSWLTKNIEQLQK